jgi:hypothetical protein
MNQRLTRQTWLLNAVLRRWSVDKQHFTKAEAEALVGKRVLTLAAWSSVPQGTIGRVISADLAGRMRDRYDVAIQWDLPTPRLQGSLGGAEEPFRILHLGNSLVDWMPKDDYVEFLTELPSLPR